MSGVIMADGQQWERCNQCAGWEKYQLLAYAPINPTLPIPEWVKTEGDKQMKIDLCRKCAAGIAWTGPYRDKFLNKEENK